MTENGNRNSEATLGRREPPLLPPEGISSAMVEPPSWRLNVNEFQLPRAGDDKWSTVVFHGFLRKPKKQRKIAKFYKKQEKIVEGFSENETLTETRWFPGTLSEDEMKQLKKSERLAVRLADVADMVLFAAEAYASIVSKSVAVIASTLASSLDQLSGLILWFTSHAMKAADHYHYPIGKKRMQTMGIIAFASVMVSMGLQTLSKSGWQLAAGAKPHMDSRALKWTIAIMVAVTIVNFILMVYCRRFKNESVRAYAQNHLSDIITNILV